MFEGLQKAILGMSLLRLFSGLLEISVAIAFLKLNSISKALMLNSALALVGPCILILTTTIGVLGMTEKLSVMKILMIFAGVTLILSGIKMK